MGGHFGCITVLCIQSLTSISLFGGSAQGESVLSSRSRGSTFTEYRNTKCWGGDFYGDGDSLRDLTGTAEDCKLKCGELDCPAFIRVHDDSQHSGKCFSRTGTIFKCFTRANTACEFLLSLPLKALLRAIKKTRRAHPQRFQAQI